MSFMFNGCSNLTSLHLNFWTAEVTTMRSLFEGCSSLELVDISNFKTTSTINVESLFSGCSLL
jgi:surface protein